MSPFQKLNILFVILALVLLYTVFTFSFSPWWILLLAVVYFSITAYFSWDIQFDFHLKTHNKGETDEKVIAITFDDGPTELTPDVLSVLKKYDAKATFFCIGQQIEKHPDILKQVYDAGHIIGGHSFSHGSMYDFLPAKQMIAEADETDDLIELAIGKRPNLFRPPYGITNPAVKKTVQSKGYETIGWSIRSFDTVNKNPEGVTNKVIKKLHPGAIVLFHDNHDRIIPVLERTLQAVHAAGYKVVSLDQLLNLKAYE